MVSHPASRSRIATAATVAVAVLVTLGAPGCSSDADDVDTSGARAQAVTRLQGFGLEEREASCVADELGPASVNEAADLSALADSQTYRDAIDSCSDG